MSERILEGTWEEVSSHASELNGRRVRLTVLEDETVSPRNDRMLAVLRRNAERLKTMPYSQGGEDTLKIIREGRSGKMWGMSQVSSY